MKRKWKKLFEHTSIRYIIFAYFTISAMMAILLTGLSLYQRLSSQMTATIQEENQAVVNQVNRSVDSYLRTIMRLSDSLYYSVIKNADLSADSINREMLLLYDSNKDKIDNIALLSKDGELIEAVPAARLKTDLDITGEEWFQSTLNRTDNLHFSMPHVQYIFDNTDNQYRWVVSMSRAVEITYGTSTDQGVLLIDINYGSLQQLLDNITLRNQGYLYLSNNVGELIYHPKMQLIEMGVVTENNNQTAAYQDGIYRENFKNEDRNITIKSVGYTGWKMVGVTPERGLALNNLKTKLFVVFILAFFVFILIVINSYISSRITNPIKALEKSVNALEEGELQTEIFIGGSYEIRHLGRSISEMAKRIRILMDDIVAEHESKRKSEFDTLQSQINPHFLYNTLDIIVWMIENEKKEQAVRVVTALARFFRISLSKGKSIITVQDEVEHVRNYLTIQQMRFKNKFTYTIDVAPEVLAMGSLKLMLQPLVENAVYHGMEFMDGDGMIEIRVFSQNEKLWFHIKDNGLGMTPEKAAGLLRDEPQLKTSSSRRSGSGIGVKNVNERIRLYFGEQFGLTIISEPDEGTEIICCLPAISYQELMERMKL